MNRNLNIKENSFAHLSHSILNLTSTHQIMFRFRYYRRSPVIPLIILTHRTDDQRTIGMEGHISSTCLNILEVPLLPAGASSPRDGRPRVTRGLAVDGCQVLGGRRGRSRILTLLPCGELSGSGALFPTWGILTNKC